MIYKIVVDKQPYTNPSDEKVEYNIDIEELRTLGDISDTLVITKDEDYVIRRLSLSQYGVLSVLETPVKQSITEVNIQLFEGDNYIYLYDTVGNKFSAKYIIKNDFTETYATTSELNSKIAVVAGQIMLEVNQKVNGEDFTAAKIVLMINQSDSEVQINADKIDITANDILNLIAGNAINLTSKNIAIASNNFNVDANGNVTCNNLSVLGGSITGGNLDLNINEVGGVQMFRLRATDHNAMTLFSGRNVQWKKTTTALPMVDIGVMSDSNDGYIDCDGDIYCENIYADNVASDRRLKKNIKESEINAIDRIKKIQHYSFDWKGKDEHHNIGYIAQDMEQIDENYVQKVYKFDQGHKKTEDFTYQMNLLPILATATKAIQEQQAELEELKKEINLLKGDQ